MALIENYTVPQYEITIPNCYWKVELENGLRGGKEKLHCRLNCFKDKTTADTNKNKYSDYDFEFVPNLSGNTGNFIKQAYIYVKTLPKFSGATDA